MIPNFNSIDVVVGLRHLMGNKKLYLKILNDFKTNYKDLKLDNLSKDEFQRVTHTLKGLSANIGAEKLYKITKELDETQDISFLPSFYTNLRVVINELESKLVEITHKNPHIPLNKDIKEKLLNELKQSAQRRYSKKCNEIIEEIGTYKLTVKDKEMLIEIKMLMKNRNYKVLVEMINDEK